MDAIKIRPYLIGSIYILTYIVCLLLKFKSCYIINALMVFPFYFLGATFKPYIEKIAFYRGRIFYALLCFLVLIGIVFFNGRTSTRGIGFGSAPIPINVMLFYTAGVIGSLMVLFISTLFKANKAITFIATSLISILGLQAIFNDPYRKFFPTDCYEIMIPTSVVILLLCTGIHWVIMKYAPQLLGKKTNDH